MTPSTYRVLDAVADSFNPLLALLALATPFLRRPRSLRSAGAYYVAAGLAIACVYLIRALDGRRQLWASVGLDYSTHSAFAASLVVSMIAFRRRWLGPLLVALTLNFCLVLFLRFHGILDILSSASLAAAAAALAHFALARERAGPAAP